MWDGRTELWNLVLLNQLRGQGVSLPTPVLRIDVRELINNSRDVSEELVVSDSVHGT